MCFVCQTVAANQKAQKEAGMTRPSIRAIAVRALASSVLVTSILGGAVKGAGSASAHSAALPSLQMGTEPWIGYGPWWIAKDKGFFAKEGLNVQLITFQQDADLNAALASGHTQVANIATHTSIKLILNSHVAITPVLVLDDSEGADAILGSSSIKSIADLRGKTVAYEYGTTSDLLIHYALLNAHIPADAVKSQNIPAADAATALVAGRVDAAVTYEPYISAVAGKGKGVHVLYSSKAAPGLIGDFMVASNSLIKNHPDQVKALLRAWNDAMEYWAKNYKDGVAIMAKGVGSSPSDLAATLAGAVIYSIAQNKSLAKGLIQKRYAMVNGVLRSTGVVKGTLDPAKTLNFSFLP
jgi:NitT/TauT family transport system substrate-binding protein